MLVNSNKIVMFRDKNGKLLVNLTPNKFSNDATFYKKVYSTYLDYGHGTISQFGPETFSVKRPKVSGSFDDSDKERAEDDDE